MTNLPITKTFAETHHHTPSKTPNSHLVERWPYWTPSSLDGWSLILTWIDTYSVGLSSLPAEFQLPWLSRAYIIFNTSAWYPTYYCIQPKIPLYSKRDVVLVVGTWPWNPLDLSHSIKPRKYWLKEWSSMLKAWMKCQLEVDALRGQRATLQAIVML